MMYCKNCGAMVNDGERFCVQCGTGVSVATKAQVEASIPVLHKESVKQQPSPSSRQTAEAVTELTHKSRKGSFWVFGAIGTAVGALLLAVILFATGVLSFGSGSLHTNARLECPGFNTPEDAAKAYLIGLKDQDLDMMRSSFAIESYVDHYDFEENLIRLKTYSSNSSGIAIPNITDFTRQMNVMLRLNVITRFSYQHYMSWNATDIFNENAPIPLLNSEEVSDFIEDFQALINDYIFADLVIGDFMEPEDLSDIYYSEQNQKNIERYVKTLGVEEEDIVDLAVTFEADDLEWLFCPQAVRYDGKWYLASTIGNLGNILGMSFYEAGIAPLDAFVD